MNILYLLDNPQLYGSEIHLFDILTHEAKINKVYLVTFREGPLIDKIKNEIENVIIFTIKSGYFISKKKIKTLKRIIYENKIQIIHAHQPKAIFIGMLVKKKISIPFVETIHSQPVDHALVCEGIKKIVTFAFHTIINYLGQKSADRIIFVSKYMLEKSKVPNKSVLIYNWIRPFLFSNVYKKNSFDCENRKIIFLYCGSVTHSKGFDKILTFCQNLFCHDITNFEIRVAGGLDKYFVEEQKKIYSKDVFEKIIFLGYVKDIGNLYKSADFFVLFSRAETFGLVYVEAMAFGLPVIASDIPVLHEIIPRENCISNDLKNAVDFVSELLKDDKKYNEISEINRNFVSSNFSFEKSMNKLDSIYAELV